MLGDFQLSTFKGNIRDFSRHKLYGIISMERRVKGTHKERKKLKVGVKEREQTRRDAPIRRLMVDAWYFDTRRSN